MLGVQKSETQVSASVLGRLRPGRIQSSVYSCPLLGPSSQTTLSRKWSALYSQSVVCGRGVISAVVSPEVQFTKVPSRTVPPTHFILHPKDLSRPLRRLIKTEQPTFPLKLAHRGPKTTSCKESSENVETKSGAGRSPLPFPRMLRVVEASGRKTGNQEPEIDRAHGAPGKMQVWMP